MLRLLPRSGTRFWSAPTRQRKCSESKAGAKYKPAENFLRAKEISFLPKEKLPKINQINAQRFSPGFARLKDWFKFQTIWSKNETSKIFIPKKFLDLISRNYLSIPNPRGLKFKPSGLIFKHPFYYDKTSGKRKLCSCTWKDMFITTAVAGPYAPRAKSTFVYFFVIFKSSFGSFLKYIRGCEFVPSNIIRI